MALGINDITTTLVGNTIGSTSHNVGILCTDANINPWSKTRPGYWYIITDANNKQVMKYQPPRGGNYTDPRGIDPQTGSDKEGYKLGDFRGYNHSAATPYIVANNQNLDPSAAGTTQTETITFYLEEFNWLNTGDYRTKNAFATNPAIAIVRDLSGTIKGWASIPNPSSGQYVDISYSYTAPNEGGTSTFDFEVWLGIGDSASQTPLFAFGDANGNIYQGSFTIHTYANPTCSVVVTDTDWAISASSTSLAAGGTTIDWSFTVGSGLGINTLIDIDLYRGSTYVATQQVFAKDGDTKTGQFTGIDPAITYDENFHIYLYKD